MKKNWNMERFGSMIDMLNIAPQDLAEKLEMFYREAQQKPKTKKNDSNSSTNNKNNDGLNEEVEYTKSSLKSIRSAINRHLTDIKRNINIVKDDIFSTANGVLEKRCALENPDKYNTKKD
ncbi:hypothetical protein KUTeg_000030 [Tegillarca granosa]|uniref:Uncharacterized protein n=1 Tax=Tegillarca granosa TaxID=220873 RepID=A0ABQ9G204_TEGGR|nr:hypothetical protein KUTeg_000030 [Tegillarca granosa]